MRNFKKLAVFLLAAAMVLCVPTAGAEAVNATYAVHVQSEDFGPGVDKAIVSFGTELSLEGVTFTVTETKLGMDWSTFSMGEMTIPRTVKEVYLCDENGVRVDAAASAYAAIEMAISPDEGNPYVSDAANFSLNAWGDPYYLTITAEGADITVDTAITAIDLSCWDTFTAGEMTAGGVTYSYAQYIPETETKTLVVWLHGMGEGGHAPELMLMCAEVPALAGEAFQSIMGGAMVLAPQCPTFWMDSDGDHGNWVNGGIQADGTSFYTESLHELIAAKKAELGAEKVIIAGCSNGGYMTMILAETYGAEYDAYVPICEAMPDELITDEQLAVLKDLSMYFIYAQNDPLVVPAVHEQPTLERLTAAGAEKIVVFAPEDVHDLSGRFTGWDGSPYQYFGHASWQYFFNNEAVSDTGINCWEWMSHAANG